MGLLFVAALAVPLTAPAAPVVPGHSLAKGVSIPLFGKDRSKPAAQLQIESMRIGAKRAGVFRVGLLPQLVGDKVDLVFSGYQIDGAALRDLSAALGVMANTESAEFLDFSIYTAGTPQARIHAASVIIEGTHDWELTRVVTDDGRSSEKARLPTGGRNAGQLIFPQTEAKPPKSQSSPVPK